MKACQNDICREAFVDRSRNGSALVGRARTRSSGEGTVPRHTCQCYSALL
ncbi:MAG: CGNR zinc finger domain-containing protein [Actinobacteria bacterium]|nr:CGNR zinc finger domain-containing protein [Actinomycetota bacterium]